MPPRLGQLGHLGLGPFFVPDLQLLDDVGEFGVWQLIEERVGFLPGGHHHKFYLADFVGQNFPDQISDPHFVAGEAAPKRRKPRGCGAFVTAQRPREGLP